MPMRGAALKACALAMAAVLNVNSVSADTLSFRVLMDAGDREVTNRVLGQIGPATVGTLSSLMGVKKESVFFSHEAPQVTMGSSRRLQQTMLTFSYTITCIVDGCADEKTKYETNFLKKSTARDAVVKDVNKLSPGKVLVSGASIQQSKMTSTKVTVATKTLDGTCSWPRLACTACAKLYTIYRLLRASAQVASRCLQAARRRHH